MTFDLKIRRFRKGSDAGLVGSWLLDRDMPESLKLDLPKLGWLVTQVDHHPIAAGFIRKMENCNVGYVDSFITNPSMPPKVRNEALNLLTMRMIEQAWEFGFRRLLASTTENHIIERACKHGFQVLPNILLARAMESKGELE